MNRDSVPILSLPAVCLADVALVRIKCVASTFIRSCRHFVFLRLDLLDLFSFNYYNIQHSN